jgi:hypothetical protein
VLERVLAFKVELPARVSLEYSNETLRLLAVANSFPLFPLIPQELWANTGASARLSLRNHHPARGNCVRPERIGLKVAQKSRPMPATADRQRDCWPNSPFHNAVRC